MKTANDYIREASALPPAPKVVAALLPLLDQEDIDASRIVELVAIEPALTAKLLQDCNSVSAGLKQPVHDLAEAVVRLGFNDIYRRVISIVSQGALSSEQGGYGIAAGELWVHSAASALAAKVLAQNMGANESLVFTAALLHDIGKIVLSKSLERSYAAIIAQTETNGCSWIEAERQLLEVDHCEVGGKLLEKWNFPANLVTAVRHHHDPAAAHPHHQLAAFVHLGDVIAHLMGFGFGHAAYAVRPQPEALRILELTQRDIEALVLEADAAIRKASWLKLMV